MLDGNSHCGAIMAPMEQEPLTLREYLSEQRDAADEQAERAGDALDELRDSIWNHDATAAFHAATRLKLDAEDERNTYQLIIDGLSMPKREEV